MNQAMQTASEINDYLDYLKAEIIKVFHKYEFMEQMPTREQVKADFNERISQKSDENGYVDDIDNRSGNWKMTSECNSSSASERKFR